MSDAKKVWVTKSCLTIGIQHLLVEMTANGDAFTCEAQFGRSSFIRRSDIHATFEAAQTRARKMRDAKMASLLRQHARISKMFEEKP